MERKSDYQEALLKRIIESDGIKKITDAITAVISGTPDVNVTDREARLLGIVTTLMENRTYDHATFDASASGNLVAAVATKVIKVHGITIQAAGTVVVNINDGSGGASLAEWTFQAREGVVYAFAPYPAHWFQTSVNTALYVTLSAAVVVTINVIYTDDDSA